MVPSDSPAVRVDHIPNGMRHEVIPSAEMAFLKDSDSKAAVAENIDRHTWKCCKSKLERHSDSP